MHAHQVFHCHFESNKLMSDVRLFLRVEDC